MPFPAVAAGIMAAKLIQGYSKGRGNRARAQAERRAQIRHNTALRGRHEANEDVRGGRLNATRGAVRNVQGSLAPGAPSYDIPDDAFNQISTRRPFVPQYFGGDPTAGTNWDIIGGLAGNAGDALTDVYGGALIRGATGGISPQMQSFGNSAAQSAGRQAMTQVQPPGLAGPPASWDPGPSAQICLLDPNYPGCNGGMGPR